MAGSQRVLITGVSSFLGCRLAQRLEAHESVERIVAVDTAAPGAELQRTDFLRADIRHSLIGRLLRSLDIDTVVHAGLIADPLQADARTMHETNVIGTMNLIAACGAADSPVRKLVVKSSTAVYGAEPDDPSIWSEDMPRRSTPRDTFTRDVDEVEGYARDFSARHPDAVTTVLRFADVLGPTHATPFGRLFDRRVIPTVAGFDPRLQFLHEDDAVAVLEQAVLQDRPGTYNVAGSGVVILSQAINAMGALNAPVLPFIGTTPAMAAIDTRLRAGFAPHLTRLLQFGRVVDTSALQERFGVGMAHTTPETVVAYARHRRVRDLPRPGAGYRYEAELEQFLRSERALGGGHPAAENGARPRVRHRPSPRATRTAGATRSPRPRSRRAP